MTSHIEPLAAQARPVRSRGHRVKARRVARRTRWQHQRARQQLARRRDFVASTAGTWQHCFDEVLTITIDVPQAVGADEVTGCQSQSYKGWGTVHAMRADGDIVIDARSPESDSTTRPCVWSMRYVHGRI